MKANGLPPLMKTFVGLLPLVLAFVLAGCTGPDDGGATHSASATASQTTTSTGPGGSTSAGTSNVPSTTPPPFHVHVAASGNTFDPTNANVPLGTRGDFHAHAGGHTVTIRRDNSSGNQVDETPAAEETVSYTFPQKGTYQVFCRFHAAMKMVVMVS